MKLNSILITASIIFVFTVLFSTTYNLLNQIGTLGYAQPSTDNATSLPPVELESVEPDTRATINESSTEYLQYEDSDIGFKIDYPSDWEVVDTALTNYAVIAFNSPDGMVEVDVKLYPRENSESLKTFANSRKNSDSISISAFYRNSTTLLGGEPAFRLAGTFIDTPDMFESLYGGESTTQKILSMGTLLKEKKSLLEVIYYADRSNYMDYLPVVEHMLKSFQFTNTKPVIQEED